MNWFKEDEFVSGCKKLEIQLSREQISQFEKFGDLIQETNRHTNLTRVPPEDYVARHFLDSLLLVPILKKNDSKKIVDIGTGAGFPGVPLAITLPEAEFLLIDSLQKRIKFIQSVVDKLKLTNVSLVHGRAEEEFKEEGNFHKYDAAVSRAVAPLDKLIPWMKPWIKIGGIGIAIKGPSVFEEVKKVSERIECVGCDLSLPHETHLAIFHNE